MRRRLLLASPWLLAACSGLSERPYTEKRIWPLTVPRPTVLPPRPRGRVLLVRSVRAAAGLEGRGLLTLQPDGSIASAFYEEWAIAPAEAVEDALRQWLAASGQFAAVLSPGSRIKPDLVLEAELTVLLADLPARRARAALAIVLIDQRQPAMRVLLQTTASAEAPLDDPAAPGQVAAERAALASAFAQIEAALAATR